MTDLPEDDRDVAAKGPDAFRTISEVAEELGLPQHVLRFWETRFPQIRPIKRGGGRRYYRPGDVDLLRGVKQLLYGQGYTIRGVQRILRETGGRKNTQEAGQRAGPSFAPAGSAPSGPGPEIWASGRRAAIEETPDPADPTDDLLAYDDEEFEDAPVAAAGARVVQPHLAPVVEARPALSAEQIGRLRGALEELAACRRLLAERT